MNPLYYVANARLPTKKAHGIQIMQMCAAFARAGREVTLIVPNRRQPLDMKNYLDPFTFYGLKTNFTLIFLPTIDLLLLEQKGIRIGPFFHYLQELSFVFIAFIKTYHLNDSIYTRSKWYAFFRCLLNRSVIYETHYPYRPSIINQIVAKRADLIVTISQSIDRSWKKASANTLYAPDGVSQQFFSRLSKDQARKKLDLPPKRKIVLYTGSLYPHKGVDTLISVIRQLKLTYLYLLSNGGESYLQTDPNNQPENIKLIGYRPYREIPIWLKAADVLVLPNSNRWPESATNTSPLKLFEYLASGTPIVASEVPAITEIVSTSEVSFFTPDNPDSLTQAISDTLQVASKRNKSKAAISLAKQYTWDQRAQAIIDVIS